MLHPNPPRPNDSVQFDSPDLRILLLRLIARLESNRTFHDDLFQEAWVCFWLESDRHPGRPLGWYLQACRFHLSDRIRAGRSIDSHKRRADRLDLAAITHRVETELVAMALDGDPLSEIVARDILTVLSPHLATRERQVLDCLVAGLSTMEIARRLNVSHSTVIEYRRRIAATALSLGITLSNNRLQRNSRSSRPPDPGVKPGHSMRSREKS